MSIVAESPYPPSITQYALAYIRSSVLIDLLPPIYRLLGIPIISCAVTIFSRVTDRPEFLAKKKFGIR